MGFLQSLECLCVKAGSSSVTAQGTKVKATISCSPATIRGKIQASSQISAKATRPRSSPVNLIAVAKISSVLSANTTNRKNIIIGEGKINPGMTVRYSIHKRVQSEINLEPKFLDKFAGPIGDFGCKQKIYPIADISNGPGIFVGPNLQSTNLYSFIDEGVATGDIDKKFGDTQLVSDDNISYIQPSSIGTNASFNAKFKVSSPAIVPRDSAIRFRAAAPLRNYESFSPPKYTIRDIKFEDPSGNLIAWYNDIIFRGDADLYANTPKNYATYSSFPKINNAALYEWQSGFPLLREPGDYTLSFGVDVESMDDPFDPGYDTGFAEKYWIPPSSYASYTQPTKNLRISAIEICASGGLGPAPENYIPIYTEVQATGRRIERRIFPVSMPIFNFDTGIWPSGETRWELGSDASYKNDSVNGALKLIQTLNQEKFLDYIKLNSTTPVANSGKLLLKFSHTPVGFVDEVTKGAFHCGFDESICGMWITPSGAFNTLNKDPFFTEDHFFVVDTVSLRVLAKKAVGSRDYTFDVVGYSDDKILNVTSAVGGFLQNIEGAGDQYYPLSSGFNPVDDLGLDGETLSDRDQYYAASGTNNAGGDHYLVATRPVVNSTEWRWYEIPLKVYEDNVLLGESKDYRMSSYFENLFLDIYPLPTGAAIAKIELLVRYAPQNALMLATQGGEMISSIQDGRSEGSLYPVARQSNDEIINAAYDPISKIENIPHAFATPSSIKSNYSRRWRGMEGTVQGAFDVDMFSFGFNNPLLDFPFVSGYYDFDYDVGTTIVPRVGTLSGTLISSLSPNKYKNLGWRFTNGSLFNTELPSYTGAYLTSDWTALSNGATNFQSHPLYGKIADAFNNIVRLRGNSSYINFGDVDFSTGFSFFIRFSPDANYGNLFDSGVLISKWDSGKNLEFTLGYNGGYLRAMARSAGGTIYSAQDTALYSTYQYPLNIIFTYNDQGSKVLKLYTDNELENNWTTLRASSATPFELYDGTSNLVAGWSSGSGIGANVFVAEFGVSSGNIVYSNPDATIKEVTAQKFLENSRMKWWKASDTYQDDSFKLWSYVDENTYHDWKIGDFKYCMFSPAFDQMQKRTGRDLISFNIVHDGLAYSKRSNMPMPSSVGSGIAYHTQIENDFLRMHLSDSSENFYSTYHRITKSLPRGYKFADKALVVETVLEHETNDQIVWPEGQIGPKLIVSLYTKRQEPYWIPNENNWGLINRSIHYVEPSSCFMRVDSTFTYDSLVDESEQWALFPREPRLKEFEEKYFSQDIDDMFLQYDLVYPSGPAFKSRINVHSAHVRLEDAFVLATENNNTLNVVTSGGYPIKEYVNLSLEARQFASGDVFNLYTLGPIKIENSEFPLYTSGALIAPATLDLYIRGLSGISDNLYLSISGSPAIPINDKNNSLNISIFGKGFITSQNGDSLGLSLISYNDQVVNIGSGEALNLFSFGSSGVIGAAYMSTPVFLYNNFDQAKDPQSGTSSGSMNLSVSRVSSALINRYPNGSIDLFIQNDSPSESQNRINLTVYNNLTIEDITKSGTLNLTIGTPKFVWHSKDYGKDIDLEDNIYASIPANDEIRGVDLIGYGACDSDSPRKAIDPPIVTHDTVWREAVCNEGGIFRAINTYTNLEAGYSGNYYGIRKFTDLIPNAKYSAELSIITGSTDPQPLPRKWEEWEYGTNDTIAFSGVKLIAESGRLANDKYGTKVAVKNDLIAVGSPFHEIPDESGSLINNAGAVFLYRRGEDIAGLKAGWNLEDVLTLPSGFRRDYIAGIYEDYYCYPSDSNPEFCIDLKVWGIGQEGRQLGHSVALASSGDREVVVVGGPEANWSRQFDTLITSGINICMINFVDYFDETRDFIPGAADSVPIVARKWDALYKYFSAPWPQGFFPKLNIKVVVCELVSGYLPPVTIPSDFNSIFYHTYLFESNTAQQNLNLVKNIFNTAFPMQSGHPHSGIPPIVGTFTDKSFSTSNGQDFDGVPELFESYYKTFAYDSGVVDIYGNKGSGYVNSLDGISQRWYEDAKNLMNVTLATGNLINNNALRYITSGVGQQWAQENAYEFQIPPTSGGRVYVFEKEFGEFNLVQEIRSTQLKDAQSGGDDTATTDNDYVHDRFGFSVSISDDAEIISIGSPFARGTRPQCEIYQRDENEYQRLLDNIGTWLDYAGYTEKKSEYDYLTIVSGAAIAKEYAYKTLSKTDKFDIRQDTIFWQGNPIKQYQNIYNFGIKQIPYIGSWYNPKTPEDFPVNAWCGTSRLGYSTAANNDGSYVAFGAPTDSLNEFDDTNMWYANGNTWASYVYAGAVRLFESRDYYPHNLVVEYYKFGNLDRNYHSDLIASGYYDQMEHIFSLDDMLINFDGPVPFRRTDFSELEIPQEAGLAFIITPEIDAASDEIIQNIKDWLEFGDRTLVLVGNDPTYEDRGLYKNSNDIINKILTKLNSRMRITSARNRYESLPNCISEQEVENKKFNVVRSFQPANGHDTHIYFNTACFAKGVGDIKIDLSNLDPQIYQSFIDNPIFAPCDSYLDIPEDQKQYPYCEMPLINSGDLRAQWVETCIDKGNKPIKYFVNWPQQFQNAEYFSENSAKCQDYPFIGTSKHRINKPFEEPRPLLTAAEWILPSSYTYPQTSGKVLRRIEYWESWEAGQTYKEFAENHLSQTAFSIFENENSQLSGIYDSISYIDFIDPDKVNNRDAFLHASSESWGPPSHEQTRVVTSDPILMLEENYNDSKVVLIASLLLESDNNLAGDVVADNDYNIPFYGNIVCSGCQNPLLVWQLGGWTQQTSFKSAYPKSEIEYEVFNRYEINLETNKIIVPNEPIPEAVNVLWVANPTGSGTPLELDKIKNWLNLPNKKLVITYSNDQQVATCVKNVCEYIGIQSAPWYSEVQGEFLSIGAISAGAGVLSGLKLNYEHPFISGCNNLFGLNTKIDELSAAEDIGAPEEGYPYHGFIPIKPGGNYVKIINPGGDLIESYWTNPMGWKLDANSSIRFSGVLPGSGYRIFVDYVSETLSDSEPLRMYGNKASLLPDASGGTKQLFFTEATPLLERTSPGVVKRASFDFKNFENFIDIDFEAGLKYFYETTYQPKTIRIVSVSGNLLPINEFTRTTSGSGLKYRYEEEWVLDPIKTVYYPGGLRPIMTDSAKHCSGVQLPWTNCDGKLIEDGPVVVAEEYENFSKGLNGTKRSKIVLITDSSMIQGACPHMIDKPYGANQRFMRSLYPPQPIIPDDGNAAQKPITSKATRRFEYVQKIVAPERGSAGKYFHFGTCNDELVRLFGGSNPSVEFDHGQGGGPEEYACGANLEPEDFTSNENNYDPRIQDPPAPPDEDKTGTEQFKQDQIDKYRFYPRLSVEIDGKTYYDLSVTNDPLGEAGVGAQEDSLLNVLGKDFLDFDFIPSGFRGDLFGYSLSMHNNKLVVGCPFNGFVRPDNNPVTWSGVVYKTAVSGDMIISGNGGAGAVFYYERTGKGKNFISEYLPWEFKQKIKPDSINIGMDNASTNDVYNAMGTGVQLLNSDFVLQNATIGDQFGYDVAIDADFMVIGAPGHDFEIVHEHIYSGSAAFIRKEFTYAFDIPLHNFYDMGNSGVRTGKYANQSGIAVMNNGAAFTFEHRIQDWRTREKKWEFAEKLVAQGYNTRNEFTTIQDRIVGSGCENDFFGRSVAIDRARRGDGDYTMIVGSPNHNYPTSGTHPTGKLENAGASYIYDAMLREQEPKMPSSGGWIYANTFGYIPSGLSGINLFVQQNTTGDSIKYTASGFIWSTNKGNIYLEASGYDAAGVGFVAHRPYVEMIIGELLELPPSGGMNLFVNGSLQNAENMNLSLLGADSAFVYNNMNLFTKSWPNIQVGSGTPQFNLSLIGSSGEKERLNLYTHNSYEQQNLDLTIRGM